MEISCLLPHHPSTPARGAQREPDWVLGTAGYMPLLPAVDGCLEKRFEHSPLPLEPQSSPSGHVQAQDASTHRYARSPRSAPRTC